MAVHPLRPATDRRLGGPLPRQQANQTRIHRIPPEIFTPRHAPLCAYAVLAPISKCYPPVYGRLSTRYSPVRHWDISLPSENFRHIPPFDLHVLGTPPAFILSQDQTLDFKLPRNIRPLENPLFSPGLIRLRSACQNLPAFCCFLLRIRVNLLLSYPVQAFSGLSFFTASFRFSFRSLNYSFFFLLESSGLHCCLFVKVLCGICISIYNAERRRRDLNPRAAINDLHPFQGCPFSHLGYFSKLPKSVFIIYLVRTVFFRITVPHLTLLSTERVGFEPTRPCGQTVFKTASL